MNMHYVISYSVVKRVNLCECSSPYHNYVRETTEYAKSKPTELMHTELIWGLVNFIKT